MRVAVPKEMTVTELSRAANIHRNRMRRLLEGRVELRRRKRTLVVRTAEVRRRLPKLWAGILAIAGWAAQRDGQAGARGKVIILTEAGCDSMASPAFLAPCQALGQTFRKRSQRS